jgi:fructokinase
VGKDDLGNEMLGKIRELSLDTNYIQINDLPTSTVGVTLHGDGQPVFTIFEDVAWDAIKLNSKSMELVSQADAISFGSLAQRSPKSQLAILNLLDNARSDCLKVLDINLRQHYYKRETIQDSIGRADVLKLNEDELRILSGAIGLTGTVEDRIGQLLERGGLKYILYTMGSDGSIIADGKELSVLAAPKVNVADTVGAGDAFVAVFTAGILLERPLDEIHRQATDIAAWVCAHKGATPNWPDLN